MFCVGQMTTCVAAPLCCRALLPVGKGGGGRFLSLSVLFFFPLASGDCSHGRTGLDLRWSERPLPLALSWNGHGQFT